jgi:hypothetical protein
LSRAHLPLPARAPKKKKEDDPRARMAEGGAVGVDAVSALLARGAHVVAEAIPGAGKTHLMARLACELPTLILAYNKQLAADIASRMGEAHADSVCLTFHALCSRCLAPAADDTQMLDAVERAERGDIAPRQVPQVRRVFVDEAQDVRALFTRLLRVLGLCGDGVVMFVAGDRNQLVYDFDKDFPATLDTLCEPAACFGTESPWTRVALNASRRLTHATAGFVNAVFGTQIEATRDGPAVEIRCAQTSFRAIDAIGDLLTSPMMLLVSHKAGNRALRTLLNTASRRGCDLHVHGVDGDGASDATVRCGTYWASKGLECETCVVVVPGQVSRNALYVALTRARSRLVVVIDAREPHAAICEAVLAHPELCDVRGEWAARAVRGCSSDADASLQPRVFPARARTNLDSYKPPRARVVELCAFTSERCRADAASLAVTPCAGGPTLDLSAVAPRVALILAERAQTGVVARVAGDIAHPVRIENERQAQQARWVGRDVSDDEVLAGDLREVARRASARMALAPGDMEAACELALAADAFDGYDHVMRRALPVAAWADAPDLAASVAWATEALAAGAYAYDVRLVVGDRHVRVQASNSQHAVLLTWSSSTDDEGSAAVRAAMHPRGTCRIMDMGTRATRDVVCDADVAALMS